MNFKKMLSLIVLGGSLGLSASNIHEQALEESELGRTERLLEKFRAWKKEIADAPINHEQFLAGDLPIKITYRIAKGQHKFTLPKGEDGRFERVVRFGEEDGMRTFEVLREIRTHATRGYCNNNPFSLAAILAKPKL